MKKVKIIGLLFVIAAGFIALFSCRNELLSVPIVPGGEGRYSDANIAPDSLLASQGEKRSITLSWNEKPNTARYYIFRANSPLNDFVRCGETTANQYKFNNVSPGSTIYYKVSAVSQEGKESPQSLFVWGTSLAQPFITDIIEVTESGVTVTWYMDNDAYYKEKLLYTVYCFDGATEIAQLPLDGALLAENKASFGNLKPNARYTYQVEAYLRGDQSISEKSEKVDAATARRMRPGAPVDLRAARGTATNQIDLTFELPDMVDVALGDSQYEPKPIYFVIQKRQYSASGTNVYHLACAYFGSNAANATEKGGVQFGGYVPGATVTWTDSTVSRGVEYEYQVQSYVDETTRVISSDTSKASARGWALSEGSLSFGRVSYTLNEEELLYASAELPLVFNFDPKGIPYNYVLVENIEPIDGDNVNNPDGTINRESAPLAYDEISTYVAQMDLTQKTTESTPGCGVYSYAVKINLSSALIDTVETIGKVEVSEDTEPIIVDGFSVQDGYTNKFVFKWHNRENRKYVLYASDNGRSGWTEINVVVNPNPDNNSTNVDVNYSYPYTTNITPGLTKYFAIRPYRDIGNGDFKQGQMVYAPGASRTLGKPVVSPSGGGASYSNITVAWPEAQKADTYRIKYWYTEDGKGTIKTAATVGKGDLSIDAIERFTYTFSPFENNATEVAKAGKEIQVEVEALNESLRAEVGGGEIATTSDAVVTPPLVGPALLGPQANRAVSTTEIDVSWNQITGAGGYYVFRRQFNMENTAEEGSEAIVYYVPAATTASISITGKKLMVDSLTNEKVDATTVKAAASFAASRYTLKDIYLPDSDYDSVYSNHTPAYRDQQNDMAQGLSYRYYIVPIVSVSESAPDSIVFTYAKDSANKNTNIASYTIQEGSKNIRYTGASALEKEGFTIGFGQNVTASKGTYASSSSNVSDRIEVKWSLPAKLAGIAGFSPRYTVYRRLSGGSSWATVQNDVTVVQFVDNPGEEGRGTACEYVVGIANGSGAVSQPKDSRRFIDKCKTFRDERDRPNYLGFMLGYVRMSGVTRGEDAALNAQLGERVTWLSAGITNNISNDYNWGIDGYTVYIMNRNINAQWHLAADNILADPSQTNQSCVLTPGNTGSVTALPISGATHDRNLLFVLRDYKHFYRVRSYIQIDEETKIYGPVHPDWEYRYRWGTNSTEHINVSNEMEDDYVKWGARQITKNEFITIASLYFARGQDRAIGTGTWPIDDRTGNASTTLGGSGKMVADYTYNWVPSFTYWEFDFQYYKDDLQARTGDWMTFVTLNGKGYARCGAVNTRPQRYYENGRGWLDVIGPWDTPHLYTGRIKFGYGNDDAGTNLKWGSGSIPVIYPTGTAEQNISFAGSNTALDFTNQSSNGRLNTSYWR